jgi:hypothetical protein
VNAPPQFAASQTPLRTDDEILARVSSIVGPEAGPTQSLWLFLLDRDDIMLPVVVPLDDVPDFPEFDLVGNVCSMITRILGEHGDQGSVVIVLSRPGPPVIGDVDRYWSRALTEGGRASGLEIRMLCVATRDGILALDLGTGAS